uniref:Uncharacterized protein n=1 Tax=Meloidogyne enterolobii TaxID=390850 RepID=A0A6V7W3J4_MELEN|nr:unnamed protein product [Meloidogyne enterolobii]
MGSQFLIILLNQIIFFRILLPGLRFWGDNNVNIAKRNRVRRSINREIKHRCDRIKDLNHNIIDNENPLNDKPFVLMELLLSVVL